MVIMIKLEHVTKKFKKETVIHDVSANFETGKITGIIGRNGSGKTVLFRLICGLMTPDSGTITVNDEVVGRDVDFPSNIGIIIESPGFLKNQSGLQSLSELAAIHHKIKRKDVIDTMKKVGLDPDDKKRVGKYSLGMRQRLGIAQAIMENPDTLILDEPMNGLDKKGVEDMRLLFSELKEQGKTILIASHNKEDIEILCDEVYEMENGRLENIKNNI